MLHHRCRSRQIFGGAKDFCPNSPPKKKLLSFWAPFFQIKACGCYFCSCFQRVCSDFQGVCEGFTDFARISTKSKLLGMRLHPRLLRQYTRWYMISPLTSHKRFSCLEDSGGQQPKEVSKYLTVFSDFWQFLCLHIKTGQEQGRSSLWISTKVGFGTFLPHVLRIRTFRASQYIANEKEILLGSEARRYRLLSSLGYLLSTSWCHHRAGTEGFFFIYRHTDSFVRTPEQLMKRQLL